MIIKENTTQNMQEILKTNNLSLQYHGITLKNEEIKSKPAVFKVQSRTFMSP